MYQKQLKKELRQIILENEGDRDDIYNDVLALVKPLIDGLIDIANPSGAYSKNPLQHANNTIENVRQIARQLLKDLNSNPPYCSCSQGKGTEFDDNGCQYCIDCGELISPAHQ